MEDIENRINYEKQRIASLNKQKDELLYDIPNYLREQLKKNLISFVGITAVFTTVTTVFGGWLLMDYMKLLLPSLLVGGSILGIGSVINYFSKTSNDRNKLRHGNISKINHDILEYESNIKYLNQQLIKSQSMVINQQMNNQPRYTKPIQQQVNYYQEESYNQGRSR